MSAAFGAIISSVLIFIVIAVFAYIVNSRRDNHGCVSCSCRRGKNEGCCRTDNIETIDGEDKRGE